MIIVLPVARIVAYTCAMARVTGPLLALLFAAVLNAPSLYLVQFSVRKAYIQRELCVQRDRMEDMRTCHGECQLSKKFRALEEEAEQGFPTHRLEIRHEPMVEHAVTVRVVLPDATDRVFPLMCETAVPGHGEVAEPVPWC